MAQDLPTPLPLLVVFDIDETLIQYVGDPGIGDDAQANFGADFVLTSSPGAKVKQGMILRPHIRTLFDYLKAGKLAGTIAVGIWTYSDKEYADMVAANLIRVLGLEDPNFFEFVYSVDDIDEDLGIPKDLRLIWDPSVTVYDEKRKKFKKFNIFNTILVDDRDRNLYHEINHGNSVFIQPFSPYGINKIRSLAATEQLQRSKEDDVFDQLQMVCQTIVSDIGGCTSSETCGAFTSEPVFTQKKVDRMGLSDQFKTYNLKKNNGTTEQIKLLTLGHVHLSDPARFYLSVSSDAGGKSSSSLGGRRTKRRRRTGKKNKRIATRRKRVRRSRHKRT